MTMRRELLFGYGHIVFRFIPEGAWPRPVASASWWLFELHPHR